MNFKSSLFLLVTFCACLSGQAQKLPTKSILQPSKGDLYSIKTTTVLRCYYFISRIAQYFRERSIVVDSVDFFICRESEMYTSKKRLLRFLRRDWGLIVWQSLFLRTGL